MSVISFRKIRAYCFVSIFAVFFTCPLFSQVYTWGKQFGNSDVNGSSSYQLIKDASDNLYLIGSFYGTIDFDPSAGVANLTSAGGSDIFISKYDMNGNYLWAKAIGGTGNDAGRGIYLDASGNIYITGNFAGTADFDPGASVSNMTAAGTADFFLAKYNSSWVLQWSKSFGVASQNVTPSAIAADASGNLYVFGSFSGGTIDFDPTAGVNNYTSKGSSDNFLTKYNTAGTYLWAIGWGGTAGEFPTGLVVEGNYCYVSGGFSSTVDVDPGVGIVNLNTAGNADFFIGKYDLNGNYNSAIRVGASGLDQGYSLYSDGTYLYLSGLFTGTVDFDPGAGTANCVSNGGADAVVAKYDLNLNYNLAISMGGSGTDFVRCVTTGAGGDMYVTGVYNGTSEDFDPGTGTAFIANSNLTTNDLFVGIYSSSGTYRWAVGMGGSGDDYGRGIVVDNAGSMYITGYFNNTVDFDPSTSTANFISTAGSDFYLVKYSVSIILPIELTDFFADCRDEETLLNWGTETETNNNYFTVLRSEDGETYEEIGRIKGAGTSGKRNTYTFSDMEKNFAYYKLKQTDFSGNSMVSDETIITPCYDPKKEIEIINTPDGEIYLMIPENNLVYELRLVAPDGRNIRNENIYPSAGNNLIKLETSGIPGGIYIVSIEGDKNKYQKVYIK